LYDYFSADDAYVGVLAEGNYRFFVSFFWKDGCPVPESNPGWMQFVVNEHSGGASFCTIITKHGDLMHRYVMAHGLITLMREAVAAVPVASIPPHIFRSRM
jgi:hypothetical protein